MGPAGGSALLPVGQVSAPSWSPFPRPGGSVPRRQVQIAFLERAQDASEIGLPISGASLHTCVSWQAVAKDTPPLCNRFAIGSPAKYFEVKNNKNSSSDTKNKSLMTLFFISCKLKKIEWEFRTHLVSY